MVYPFLRAPFADPARQQQFDAVHAALAAEPACPPTLLLGNVWVEGGAAPLDAVVIRPHSLTLLLLEPGGGRLSMPDFAHGAWQLGDAQLAGRQPDIENPFQQFLRQKASLARYLAVHLPEADVNLNFITGLLLFGQEVVFDASVEARMAAVPEAGSFHLLANPARFTRRLAQLARPEIDLTENEIEQLAQRVPPAAEASNPTSFFSQHADSEEVEQSAAPDTSNLFKIKAAQLWRWLGAEDLADVDRAPYGYDGRDLQEREQEKAALEKLRTSLQTELAEQLRAMEKREAEREASIAQLRAQLAQAPPVAPEAAALQLQLAQEQREKAALEAAILASRAESAARNRELDARILQLENLMRRVRSSGRTRIRNLLSNNTLQASLEQLRRWPRLGVVASGLGVLALTVVGLKAMKTEPLKPFEQEGKWGFANASGKPVIPARYATAADFYGDRAVVKRNGVYGFVDRTGQEVVAPAYDALSPYTEGYARVKIGDLYTFIDEDGREFNSYYYNALDFSEGHAAVRDRRGWFYITGLEEEPATGPIFFQEAYSFHDGLARVKLDGAYTFITADYLADPKHGTEPFGRYAAASDFTAEHRARVRQDGRTFYIDRKGKVTD